MSGGGLRLQIFAALAITVVAAALGTAVLAYHVFDRELQRAFEARLQMLVAETGRVLDAGITAGLDLERPQLLRRAMRNLVPNLGVAETIAVADEAGRIIASSNPAEIGEPVPVATVAAPPEIDPAIQLERGRTDTAPLATRRLEAERLLLVRPIQSLFGQPAGHVVATLDTAALDQPRRAYVAKFSLTTAGLALLGLILAAAIAFGLSWRVHRIVCAIERVMGDLYRRIGTQDALSTVPSALPKAMRPELERFTAAVDAREYELRARAEAIDTLDEAA